jgi:hypothetical protein
MANMSFGGGASSSFYDLARQGRIYTAFASVTAPVIYSTAAATGGPLLWNNTGPGAGNNSRVMAVILGVSCGWTTAPSASGVIGLTGNTGQSSAPTSTTAIDTVSNNIVGFSGSDTPTCNVYRVGTVTNAGNFFFPTHSVSTAGTPSDAIWCPLDGLFIVQPGGWIAVSAAATATSMVGKIGLMWAEIPF